MHTKSHSLFYRTFIALLVIMGSSSLCQQLTASENDQAYVLSIKSLVEKKDVTQFRLGQRFLVKVANLEILLKEAKDNKKKIVPFINDIPISGIHPFSINRKTGELGFKLERTPENRSAWTDILGAPKHFDKKITASVGIEGFGAISIDDDYIQDNLILYVIVPWRFWFALVLLVLIFIGFLHLAVRKDFIRDAGPKPKNGKLRPYSLARFQMAVWFLLTITAFLTIWLLTGAYDTIPESVFILIGIGSGTALGVTVQDSTEKTRFTIFKERLEKLQKEQNPTSQQQSEISELVKKIDDYKHPGTIDFLTDVLTDARGISFHRYQIFAWTIVLAFLFIIEVYTKLAMPDFDGTLLALMGISSATYIGFMIPEGPSVDQNS